MSVRTQFCWELWEACRMLSNTVYLKKRSWLLFPIVPRGDTYFTLKYSTFLSSAHFRPHLRENPEDKSWKMHIMCLRRDTSIQSKVNLAHKTPRNATVTTITGGWGNATRDGKDIHCNKNYFSKNLFSTSLVVVNFFPVCTKSN